MMQEGSPSWRGPLPPRSLARSLPSHTELTNAAVLAADHRFVEALSSRGIDGGKRSQRNESLHLVHARPSAMRSPSLVAAAGLKRTHDHSLARRITAGGLPGLLRCGAEQALPTDKAARDAMAVYSCSSQGPRPSRNAHPGLALARPGLSSRASFLAAVAAGSCPLAGATGLAKSH